MAVLFSQITISADNGAADTFLCGGIPTKEEDLKGWTTYRKFKEENPDAEHIDVEVKSFLYGEGDIVDADEYEIAYFTKRGEGFTERSTVKPYDESNFIIETVNEENIGMEMN